MKRALLLAIWTAFALALLGGAASAQNCSGQPAANTVCAGPASGPGGLPSFRALTPADTGAGVFVGGATAGTSTAYTLATVVPSGFTLTANVTVIATVNATNGANATLSVNGTAATAINRRSTSGLSALVGGEMVANQKYMFVYDGSVFELLTRVPGSVEQKSVDYPAVAADFNGDIYIFTAARTITLPAANTVPNNGQISVFAESGNVTVALASGTDIINAGVAGASLTLSSGAFSIITTDGSGHWYVPSPTTGSGTVGSGTLGQPCVYTGAGTTCAGNNTVAADVYFKSGAPWVDVKAFGALGNGVADDTTAIQNAINSLAGGTVYFPPGTYCTFTGLSTSAGSIRLLGSGGELGTASTLSACGHDATVVRLNGGQNRLENFFILGGPITSTKSAVKIDTSCVECYVAHNRMQFGTHALEIAGSDNFIFDNVVTDAYGNSLVRITGADYITKLKSDQTYPVSTPSAPFAPAAWTNGHVYTVGTVVSNSGFYIQATGNCTSGTIAPTNQNYSINIVDNAGGGTCIWQLVQPVTYYSVNIDTGVTFLSIHDADVSGPFTAGIYQSNSLAGTAPQTIFIDHVTAAAQNAGIWLHDGGGVSISHTQIVGCIVASCSGILASNSFVGDLTISDSLIFSNPVGINLAAGVNTEIVNNTLANASSGCIVVQATVSKFKVVANNLGTSPTWGACTIGVQVLAGASDYYTIAHNVTIGAGTEISDSGTGIHKLVFDNGTSVLLALANGGTNNTLTASNGGILWSDASKLNILAGTATANLPLLSGATATPAWATVSYPTSATSGGVPYFSSTSAMASSALLAANQIVVGGGAGNPPVTGTGCSITNSSLICTSSTAFFPQAAMTNATNDANSASFLFNKNRAGGNTILNDTFIDIQGRGFATAGQPGVRILGIQTGASSGSNIPTKWVFYTGDTAGQLDNSLTLDSASHVSNTQNTAPSLTAGCNGAGSSVSGTDMQGTVTGQTAAATTCTLTFGTAYSAAPNCAVTGLSSPLTGAVTPATGTLVVNFTSTANFKWSYVCHGA